MAVFKALSLKQPWANMIASGEKIIETRRWPTDYRGPLLIVSSKSPNIPPTGCAVALVTLCDCRRMAKADESAARCRLYAGAYAWVLQDIRRLKPFPVRGQLGIYDVVVEDATLAFE